MGNWGLKELDLREIWMESKRECGEFRGLEAVWSGKLQRPHTSCVGSDFVVAPGRRSVHRRRGRLLRLGKQEEAVVARGDADAVGS